jgi:hypothetical protein
MIDKEDFDFDKVYNNHQNYKKERENKFKEFSNNRLYNITKKKIQTTMIGALATVEKYFEPLLNSGDKQIKRVFEDARSEILDKGNAQIRNLESEFSNYDIVWKKNNIVIPFIEKK